MANYWQSRPDGKTSWGKTTFAGGGEHMKDGGIEILDVRDSKMDELRCLHR